NETTNEEIDVKTSSKENVGGVRRTKSNLKNQQNKAGERITRRVSFDPLALLLDAALEGELELVKKTAPEVPNPSSANDEGITALHNAICAKHFDVVKYLIEIGCDVNLPDSDGWTPLHCAASCNSLITVKFLVEHGACIFATTISDHETAAEKCEEDEDGFEDCSQYLKNVQDKLGVLNGAAVYAVYEYDAQNVDELSFKDGDRMTVLRKGDEQEKEWWWCKLRDKEGYVPRNLLGD
ncbi:apoptosis-stimulating of p53 protein 1-like isoform X4, partial [Leptotrombidium deliense]